MNILIMTSRFGMGHYYAAEAIKEQLQLQRPGDNIIICDFMKRFQEKTGSLKCAELKKKYAAHGQKCAYILESAGEILDQIIEKYADYIIEAYRQDVNPQPECSPQDRRIG